MTSYTHTQTFQVAANVVYDAIMDVRGWWSGTIDGPVDKVGAEFRYRYPGMHDSTQRVTELVPGKKIVWRVTDATLTFVSKPSEWKGTEIVFELVPVAGGTELRFTHVGLVRAFECYDACSSGWRTLLTKSLPNRIMTGTQQPDVFA
ncbi:MAG: SRPBCC domain-containing protein [Kofleriaceae bacterium]